MALYNEWKGNSSGIQWQFRMKKGEQQVKMKFWNGRDSYVEGWSDLEKGP